MKEKRYFFSVVEEFIQNPDYAGYRAGRIEVHDNHSKSEYAVYEARFMIPEEFYQAFCDLWDFRESDLMPMIHWEVEK